MSTRLKQHDLRDQALIKRIIDNAFGISVTTGKQTRELFCNVGRFNMRRVQFVELVENDSQFKGRAANGDLWQFTSFCREVL